MAILGFGRGDYEDPSKAAMPYLEQIPETIQPYYQPYIDWGIGAGQNLYDYYGNLITSPEDYYYNIMMGYQASPEYQYQSEQLQKQMEGNAAAGGYTGTAYDQQTQADEIQKLIARDQQRYFNNIYGIQNTGAQGEQHLFDTGYGASTGYADRLASNLAQEAGLQYKSTADKNQYNNAYHNAVMNALLQGAGIGAGVYFRGK